jgi:hypothetical protein
MEHAILTGEILTAPNITLAFSDMSEKLSSWEPIDDTPYNVTETLELVIKQWEDYKEILESAREYCKDNQPIADEINAMIAFWELEVEYKMKRAVQ